MKVKVGNKVYDGNNEPVMVILSDEDKFNIAHMDPKATKYASYPEGMTIKEIQEWMREEPIEIDFQAARGDIAEGRIQKGGLNKPPVFPRPLGPSGQEGK